MDTGHSSFKERQLTLKDRNFLLKEIPDLNISKRPFSEIILKFGIFHQKTGFRFFLIRAGRENVTNIKELNHQS